MITLNSWFLHLSDGFGAGWVRITIIAETGNPVMEISEAEYDAADMFDYLFVAFGGSVRQAGP